VVFIQYSYLISIKIYFSKPFEHFVFSTYVLLNPNFWRVFAKGFRTDIFSGFPYFFFAIFYLCEPKKGVLSF
jgi:hypothetical protein